MFVATSSSLKLFPHWLSWWNTFQMSFYMEPSDISDRVNCGPLSQFYCGSLYILARITHIYSYLHLNCLSLCLVQSRYSTKYFQKDRKEIQSKCPRVHSTVEDKGLCTCITSCTIGQVKFEVWAGLQKHNFWEEKGTAQVNISTCTAVGAGKQK